MGISRAAQADEIKKKAFDLMTLRAEPRPRKRIYIRPRKQEKKLTKIKVLNPNRMVFCKICFKKIVARDAVEVIGGSEQGHKNFWMCREHM